MGRARRRAAWTDFATGQAAAPKYGARATVRDGIRFASRLEADRYSELKWLQREGAVRFFLRQVPFDVAEGVRWRADFVVFWKATGGFFSDAPPFAPQVPACVTIEDTKGHLTDASRVRIKVVEGRYNLRVRILRRADVRSFLDVA